MTITPISDYLLVRPDDAETSVGRIIIPHAFCEKCFRGEVLAAGPGRKHYKTGVRVSMAVKPGDRVCYGKYAGTEFEDGKAVLVREADVLCVME